MRQSYSHARGTLAVLLLCVVSSALLVAPAPPLAKAQQEGARQLQQEEAKRQSGRRLALVIGNSAYQNASPLKNPTNDAADMAKALSDVGFTVEHGVDLNQKQMKFMIRQFGQKLKAGGQGVFFYAGHGVQSKGRNYLIPVDALIESEADVEDAGVDVQFLLNYMDDAQNGLNIVILDACRNNPFARSFRSAENGLAQVDAPTGTLIAYATAPGKVASDGPGQNGLYTSELLKQMRAPGVSVTEMFMRVRAEVVRRTGGKQVPWEASSLIGTFSFNAATPSATNKTTGAAKADPAAVEQEYWETIKSSRDAEDFREYLKEYPSGPHAVIARSNLRRLGAAAKSSASEPKPTSNVPATKTTNSTTRPSLPAWVLPTFQYETLTLDKSGKVKSREMKFAEYYEEDLSGLYYEEDLGGIKLEMVKVPSGTFLMGSPETEADRFASEGPQHRVSVQGFYMGKYEVTQAQYLAIMGMNPSELKGDNLPVEQVSWNDAVEFCKRLSAKKGREYRLPSEAEWEYAARAGTQTPFAFGETITPEIVNYDGNYPYGNAAKGSYRKKAMTVGWSGVANAFGLYDMHGNVWEWCLDYWHESYGGLVSTAPTDGSAWMSGGDANLRVLRGGSWPDFAFYCRSAMRLKLAPDIRSIYLNFQPAFAGRIPTISDAPSRRLINLGFRVVAVART